MLFERFDLKQNGQAKDKQCRYISLQRPALDPNCPVFCSNLICLNISFSQAYICWINLSWTESWSIFAERSNLRAAERASAVAQEDLSLYLLAESENLQKGEYFVYSLLYFVVCLPISMRIWENYRPYRNVWFKVTNNRERQTRHARKGNTLGRQQEQGGRLPHRNIYWIISSFFFPRFGLHISSLLNTLKQSCSEFCRPLFLHQMILLLNCYYM